MGNQIASSTAAQLQRENEVILNRPAGTPPAGVQPNFNNPANLNSIVYTTTAIALFLPTLAISIRIYTRHFLLRSMGRDDYISFIAWLGLIGYITLSLLAGNDGFGVHLWDMRLGALFRLLYWANIVDIFFNPVNVLVKASILFQFSRIFNPIGRINLPMSIAIQISIWSLVLLYFIAMFFAIFQCSPREKIWNKLATEGHCYNLEAVMKATGIFNVISDFVILILPLLSIWNLQMPPRKKLSISGVFAVGFIGCLMSIMRTYYIWQIVESADINYNLTLAGIWTNTELAVGIIIGSLPIMPKFFQHINPKICEAFYFHFKAADRIDPDRRDRSIATEANTPTKTKNPFAKYKVGPSVFETSNDPITPLNSECYTLNESQTSQHQAGTVNAPTRVPSVWIATRWDDLEHGNEPAEADNDTE